MANCVVNPRVDSPCPEEHVVFRASAEVREHPVENAFAATPGTNELRAVQAWHAPARFLTGRECEQHLVIVIPRPSAESL